MKRLAQWLVKNTAVPALHGGLHLPRDKPGLNTQPLIGIVELPDELVLPLLNYRRESLLPWVEVGQAVQQGEALASGLIASATGCVAAIEPRPVIHPSGQWANCVVIKVASQHDATKDERRAVHPPLTVLSHERLAECAVNGLGGAGFATASKFEAAGLMNKPLSTLLINAVECEPMISCDEALMMSQPGSVVQAIEALVRMTDCQRCVLAIEDDKLAAISAMQRALEKRSLQVEIQLLPPVYPAGAERTLIRRITGIELRAGERPVEHGIVCINVATALAAWQAQLGFPQISRIVTIAGSAAQKAVNVRVRFGTSVAEVLRQSGNEHALHDHLVRVGGPLSGFDIDALQAPVTATSNCISIRKRQFQLPVQACIRCNACSDVCPEQLLPQQLLWYARGDDISGAQRFGLDSCIECACCDIVCPSAIPLTSIFRHARYTQREQQRQDELAKAAEERFQAREKRLAERAAAREEQRLAAKNKLSTSSTDPIADALARSRQRRKSRAARMPGPSKPDKT